MNDLRKISLGVVGAIPMVLGVSDSETRSDLQPDTISFDVKFRGSEQLSRVEVCDAWPDTLNFRNRMQEIVQSNPNICIGFMFCTKVLSIPGYRSMISVDFLRVGDDEDMPIVYAAFGNIHYFINNDNMVENCFKIGRSVCKGDIVDNKKGTVEVLAKGVKFEKSKADRKKEFSAEEIHYKVALHI
jgi:hypothetical protein